MLGALQLAFEMNDGSDRLDPKVWKAIVTCALTAERRGAVPTRDRIWRYRYRRHASP